jgi:flagellar biosynthetic protein FlhB
MAEGGDRTEQATPKRREESRRKGQVAVSTEVSPVLVLLTALTLAHYGAPVALDRCRLVLGRLLAAAGPAAAHDDAVGPFLVNAGMEMGRLLLPFWLATAVVGFTAMVAQVGWSLNPELGLPDLGRLSPANGLKRIFSTQGAMNLAKAVVKILVVLLVAYRDGRAAAHAAVATPDMPLVALLGFTGATLGRLLLHMALALGALGALDVLWQRWRHEQSLKMSRHEVKEETKEAEGDPQIKMRFKRAHREVAKRRMLAEVKRADVVLTNPTHYAVALRYRAEEMVAPRVVAKGAGELAAKIKDEARRAGVPIVERRALARALFRSVALGAEIPPALYRAVAEILAYIYSLRAPAPAGEAR